MKGLRWRMLSVALGYFALVAELRELLGGTEGDADDDADR